MAHLAGCVSRKLCGSVEGSEVVCHLKRWQKHNTCAVAAFSTLLVERAAPRARGNRKGWTEFPFCKKEVRSLGARGVRESPRHTSRGMLLWLIILFYLCLSMFTRAGGKSLATAVSGEQYFHVRNKPYRTVQPIIVRVEQFNLDRSRVGCSTLS